MKEQEKMDLMKLRTMHDFKTLTGNMFTRKK